MEKIHNVTATVLGVLSTGQLHICICVLAVVICALVGILLYRFYKKGKELREEELGKRLYESLEDSFRESSPGAYQKQQKWLKSIGAEYSVKGFGDPFLFVVINLLLFVGTVLLFGLMGKFLAGCGVAALLIITEILVLIALDQKTNQEMLNDISFLYDATAIQLSSNIYVAQAVANCLVYIRNKRLKQALTELVGNLALGGDVRAATADFSEKFNNEYLSTFCNAVVQIAAQTGEAGKLIEDMSRQLAVMKATNFASRKKATENKLQLCIMGIFILFTVLIFILCIASMTGSADMLF